MQQASSEPFFVPHERLALALRNGVPDRFFPPGFHALLRDKAKVEVRLLRAGVSASNSAFPDASALALPYERGLLYLEGALVGVVKPFCGSEPEQALPVITTWEGFDPSPELRDLDLPQACLSEPLRTCLPRSGRCCGARMPLFAA
jgi:hypothetical protein